MGTIRLEYVPVQKYFLGLFGFHHLQIVYQDETDVIDKQDYWFVLEGVYDGGLTSATLGVAGADGRTSLGVNNDALGDDLVSKIGTPGSRGSRIILSSPNAIVQWDSMAAYGREIDVQKLPYISYALPIGPSPIINSTSAAASILWSIGIDLQYLWPFGIGLSPGSNTLIGTSEGDNLTTTPTFTTLVGGLGEDHLHGSGGLLRLEKMYGGLGNDTFYWSEGYNLFNGGQPLTPYAQDGRDLVNYSGVGSVHFEALRYSIENKVADFLATTPTGEDQLFSIEQIRWDGISDTVTGGANVGFIQRPVTLEMLGATGGHGDELSFNEAGTPLLINAVGDSYTSIQTLANQGLDAGIWASSVEWVVGSSRDDSIYTGPTVYGADGGLGADLIDARLSAAFSGDSPLGYDIELFGGEGDDTLVSGAGRTDASGGAGADRFVLSSMSSGEGTVEFVIEDADSSDRLYVPFAYFKEARGPYEGSELFQLSGAPFDFDQDNPVSYFYWSATENDQVHGYIDFVGAITYEKQGSDLLIKVYEGHAETIIDDSEPGAPPITSIENVWELETETHVLVRNWYEGVLGITFPLTMDPTLPIPSGDFYDYPGLRDEIQREVAGDRFVAPLEERPEEHTPLEIASSSISARPTLSLMATLAAPPTDGTEADDVLTAPATGGPFQFNGYGGSDDITGSAGGDLIDGGAGADIMRGGRGNDTYIVDDAGDQVIEDAVLGGYDIVYSAIDYQLGALTENLVLTGTARNGTGNALANRISGNALDNTLSGGGGDDTMAGNGGNDQLAGGAGSDAYVYELGDGRDIVTEAGGTPADEDVLVLAGGLTLQDVAFQRPSALSNDLVIAFSDGGRVTIADYFLGDGAGIEVIATAAGLSWTAAEVAAHAAAAIITDNTAPVAQGETYGFDRGTSVVVPYAALLENDTDFDGDTLSVTALSNVVGGTAALADGGVAISAGTGVENPVVRFDYTVSDGHGGSATAHFDLAFTAPAPNTPPQIVSATLGTVVEDTPASGALVAQDQNGDVLQFAVKPGAGPARGSVTLNADGTFTYTPLLNAFGDDQFTLTVTDGLSTPVEQVFSVNILPVNDAPVAVNDGGFSGISGLVSRISAASLLANDYDADGDALSLSAVANAVGGSVTRDVNGDVLFTPAPGFSGTGSFVYTITDGAGGTATATATLTVTPPPVNTAPVILSATLARVIEDTPAAGRIVARDAEGDVLSYRLADGQMPTKGRVALSADGSFVYTPNANATGLDRFTVIVSDGAHEVRKAFAFLIAPVNDAPVAGDDTGPDVRAGQTVIISTQTLLRNDSDVDDACLRIVDVSGASGGQARLLGNSILFTAARTAGPEASFHYTVSDGHGGFDTATVTLDVEPVGGHPAPHCGGLFPADLFGGH